MYRLGSVRTVVLSCAFVISLTVPSLSSARPTSPGMEGASIVQNSITPEELKAAQDAWGAALIQISKDYESKGIKKATATANAVLDGAYGYNMGAVLFKPTLTHGEQTFRTSKDGALAYFVGQNKKYPGDSGFALRGWEKYEYQNAGLYYNGDMAITMGNVYLTDKTGKTTMVNKTWGFKKDNQGKLRIVLHHSSLPFQPN